MEAGSRGTGVQPWRERSDGMDIVGLDAKVDWVVEGVDGVDVNFSIVAIDGTDVDRERKPKMRPSFIFSSIPKSFLYITNY